MFIRTYHNASKLGLRTICSFPSTEESGIKLSNISELRFSIQVEGAQNGPVYNPIVTGFIYYWRKYRSGILLKPTSNKLAVMRMTYNVYIGELTLDSNYKKYWNRSGFFKYTKAKKTAL